MQPFPVLCETCGAKLKVRDMAAVGQIHACPKCDSMVLIALPAAWADTTTDLDPSTAASSPPVTTETIAPVDFAAEVDRLLQPPTGDASKSVPAEEFVANAESTSDSVQSVTAGDKTAALVWGTAGAVAFCALGLLAAAWWSRGDDSPDSTSIVTTAPANQPEAMIDIGEEPTQPDPQTVAAKKPVVEPTDIDPKPITPQTSSTSSDAEKEAPKVDPLPVLPTVPPPMQPGESVANDSSERHALPPLDPLAIDLANLDLLLVPHRTVTDKQPARDEIMGETLAMPETEAIEIGPAPLQLRFEPGSASRGPSFAEGFADEELNSRLAMQMPSISWHQTPLHIALGELGQLSGVPLSVDPRALCMAGVTARHPISFQTQETSVRDVASAVASLARLEFDRVPGGLVLAKPGAEKWRQVNYEVDDLVASGDADDLVRLITQFVQPRAWESAQASIVANGSSLRVNQKTAVHYEILIFCERLRKARGLATRSKYPAALLHTEPKLAGLDKHLQRTTTFAFVDWTPLAEVFDYWQESGDIAIVVDWRRLADQDQRPLATMAGSVNNVTWANALDACLAPQYLDWVPVDSTTIQITTVDAATASTWVEFYSGSKLDDIQQRVEAIDDEASLAAFSLAKDPTTKFVIVRGNRAVHEAARH